jgi:DNA-binding transcriptional LysR family regulator
VIETYRAMVRPPDFDPAGAQAEVTVICNYYERLLLIPTIVRRLRDAAPGIRLQIVNASSEGHQRLLEGAGDVLLGPFLRRESGVYSRPLFDEEYACLVDPAHPAADHAPTLEAYLDFDHILITYDGSWKSRYLQELDRAGHGLRVALKVPSPAGVARLVSGGSLVATVPARLARRIGPDLAVVPCPVPAPFRIGLVWTARHHAEPMHRWLRDSIADWVEEAVGGV